MICMSDLTCGDVVRTERGWSPVVGWLHRSITDTVDMLEMVTSMGTLVATPNHLFFRPDGTAVAAGLLQPGDQLAALESSACVLSTRPVQNQGYFAPLTEEGQLEVGGVSASCYIEICLFGWKVPHHVMNVVMWPFRVNPAWMPKAWPQFQSLGLDSAQSVRAALAQVLGPVAKALGRDVTQRQLLSLISDLMKDEFHDVRLNIVSHAGLICEVLSVDGLVHSLLHTVQNLIMDNHWRIRQSVVEQVPKLSRLFGMEMFQSKLENIFLSSLRDSVHSVRQAAIQHLKDIADTFGSQWTVEHLLPKLVEQYSGSVGYANRVTTLHVLPQVSFVMTPEQLVQCIVPLLVRATKDSVPNVRFCACRTIMWMMEHHNLGAQNINTIIKPCLSELEHDPDIDVQYYAQRALLLCARLGV
ncbi:unnamed protein product [Durusdinium trenchii]|uniref:Uncharacterized protein n=1 Tax=Durusdinium trenchii TaxID=1381693 RepID=A0ABP0N2E0_9DINO